jgi:hypothetical protein
MLVTAIVYDQRMSQSQACHVTQILTKKYFQN